MRTNTEELITDYYDFGDGFAVYLPMQNGNQGLLMYVPKSLELFRKMDNKMDFRDWYGVIKKMELRSVKVIFPTFSQDTERDIQRDWTDRIEKSNIFVTNATHYEGMTTWNFLYADNFVQRNGLTFDSSGMRYASLTFLTLRRDQEMDEKFGKTRIYHRTHPPLTLFPNSSDVILTVTGREPTTSNNKLKREIINARNLSLDSINASDNLNIQSSLRSIPFAKDPLSKDTKNDTYFHPVDLYNRRKNCISRKRFSRPSESRKFKCGPAKSIRNCENLLRIEGCKRKDILQEERREECRRIFEFCREYLRLLKKTKILRPIPTTLPQDGEYGEQVTALINTSFFYAVINRDNGIFYSVGRVYHCP